MEQYEATSPETESAVGTRFESKAAYVYTSDSSRRAEIEAEAESARRPMCLPMLLCLLKPPARCDFAGRLNSIPCDTWSALPRRSKRREDGFSRPRG
jgi:hypothetical protein